MLTGNGISKLVSYLMQAWSSLGFKIRQIQAFEEGHRNQKCAEISTEDTY